VCVTPQLHSLTDLNLSLCNLTSLPFYICYLHSLETLILSGNKLSRSIISLPCEGSGAMQTNTLAMLTLPITLSLPMSLCLMTNLESLDLSSNNLGDESSQTGNFPTSLKSLSLAYNRWSSFPLGILVHAGMSYQRSLRSWSFLFNLPIAENVLPPKERSQGQEHVSSSNLVEDEQVIKGLLATGTDSSRAVDLPHICTSFSMWLCARPISFDRQVLPHLRLLLRTDQVRANSDMPKHKKRFEKNQQPIFAGYSTNRYR